MIEHPRETALELFVLGSESQSDADRDAIDRHLERCAGCRGLVETIREFYQALERDLGTVGDNLPVLSPENLPTKIRRPITSRGESAPAPHEVDTRLPFRVARWMVRAPFLATAGAVTGLSLVAMLILLLAPGKPDGGDAVPRDSNAVELRIQGLMLEALNKYGERVGEFQVNREIGDSYRSGQDAFGKLVGLLDADGDGRNEVVWVERRSGEQETGQRIHCVQLNPVRALWTHEVRRELDYVSKPGADLIPYSVQTIRLGDIDRDGRPEVYVLLNSSSFSAEVLKLDAADGKETGCYVHTGGIAVIEFLDIDGDSIPELLLGGTNNSWNEGTVAILDPRRISGQSVHSEPYDLRNTVPANEKAYIRIPRTMVGSHNPRNVRNFVDEIAPNVQNHVFRVGFKDDVPQGALFISCYLTFGPGLEVLDADPGDGYTLLADSLYRAGELPGPADAAYFRAFAGQLSWWDGERWLHAPAWNRNGRPVLPPS